MGRHLPSRRAGSGSKSQASRPPPTVSVHKRLPSSSTCSAARASSPLAVPANGNVDCCRSCGAPPPPPGSGERSAGPRRLPMATRATESSSRALQPASTRHHRVASQGRAAPAIRSHGPPSTSMRLVFLSSGLSSALAAVGRQSSTPPCGFGAPRRQGILVAGEAGGSPQSRAAPSGNGSKASGSSSNCNGGCPAKLAEWNT
mmetsp:Transcript_78935/g.218421  ORF Transcript_78935/g.218421 Transcript_78935/m.218421 type:complete len:202 (-) Transcript_78935:2583-3188(-)